MTALELNKNNQTDTNPSETNTDKLLTQSTPPQSPPQHPQQQQTTMIQPEFFELDETATPPQSAASKPTTSKFKLAEMNKIKDDYDKLKHILKSSYDRLRSIQTKHFKSHVELQLNKILKLREEQQSTSAVASTQQQIDERTVELLNSILLKSAEGSSSATAAKNLAEDVEYELSKQKEDKSAKRSGYLAGISPHSSLITSDASDSDTEVDEEDEYEPSSSLKSNSSLDLNKTSESSWSMRRCQLGSEWERVQTKLKMLSSKNSSLNAYIASYNGLMQNWHSPDENRQDEQAIEALQESLKQTARCAPTSRSEVELIRFDDGLIKQFYQTLINYKTFLFRSSCTCGSLGSRKRKLAGTCIFCHLFRQYEVNRMRSKSKSSNEVDVEEVTGDESRLDKLDADIKTVRVDHSYCKQPRCGSDAKTKRLNELFEQRDNEKLVDFDDGLIDKIINERLSRIFDGGSGKGGEKRTEKKRQFKSIFSDGFELDLKQHENRFVDAGIDLSPSDIKKLPNLTYDEYENFFL
jgi:hypothetical protein